VFSDEGRASGVLVNVSGEGGGPKCSEGEWSNQPVARMVAEPEWLFPLHFDAQAELLKQSKKQYGPKKL